MLQVSITYSFDGLGIGNQKYTCYIHQAFAWRIRQSGTQRGSYPRPETFFFLIFVPWFNLGTFFIFFEVFLYKWSTTIVHILKPGASLVFFACKLDIFVQPTYSIFVPREYNFANRASTHIRQGEQRLVIYLHINIRIID